jgi:hypothetical protein
MRQLGAACLVPVIEVSSYALLGTVRIRRVTAPGGET